MITQAKQPIYCKDCRARDSWVRVPDRDIVSADTGIVMWERWECSVCKRTVISEKEVDNEG